MSEKVLAVSELASALKVCLPTARQLLKSGAIRGARCGGHWRVLESTVTAFLRGEGASGTGKSGSQEV